MQFEELVKTYLKEGKDRGTSGISDMYMRKQGAHKSKKPGKGTKGKYGSREAGKKEIHKAMNESSNKQVQINEADAQETFAFYDMVEAARELVTAWDEFRANSNRETMTRTRNAGTNLLTKAYNRNVQGFIDAGKPTSKISMSGGAAGGEDTMELSRQMDQAAKRNDWNTVRALKDKIRSLR